MKSTGLLIACLTATAACAQVPATNAFRETLERDWAAQYAHLAQRLTAGSRARAWEMNPKIRAETFRDDALVAEQDRDPVDVVLRQTEVMLRSLRKRDAKVATSIEKELAPLATAIRAGQPLALAMPQKGQSPPVPMDAPRYRQYRELCALQRKAALADPLLDFGEILFARRISVPSHHASIHYGLHNLHGNPESAICRLSGWREDRPAVTNLLEGRTVATGRFAGRPINGGVFGFPSLSYDAQTLYFSWIPARMAPPPPGVASEDGNYQAYRAGLWSPHQLDTTWKVLALDLAGGPIRMLADDAANNCAPCELPDGRIVYVSDRRGGVARCGGPTKSGVLHTMRADGSDVTAISVAEISEYRPSVTHDGRIIYTRWDYVDRDDMIAHHPWIVYPDGRDARAPHGNYPTRGRGARPDVETDIKAIPGSHRYIATATGHHGPGHNGSLIVLDFNVPDDNAMSQVRRVTPEESFPEVEYEWSSGALFRSAWPLDEEHYLCAFQRPGKETGIYLVDAFGNRVLLYLQTRLVVTDPIPLKARPRPPVLPSATVAGAKTGTLGVINVYASDSPWPANTTITALRVVQIFPKANGTWMNFPDISHVTESTARSVLGTVPVAADGSALFTVPADVPLYLQALDASGRAVGMMRSTLHVPPGTRNTCYGCHENQTRAPETGRMPLAFQQPPVTLRSGPPGSNPIFYPRLVQPVLDKHCAACHAKESKAPVFSPEPVVILAASPVRGPATVWTKSYLALTKAFGAPGGGGKHGPARSVHGRNGSFASRLYDFVTNGKHHGVKLAGEDLERLLIWQDNNCNFLGNYHKTEEQARGELPEMPAAIQPELVGAKISTTP
jgi:hypothetical protein